MTATRPSSLQRMARRAAREREEALEHCDLCSAPIAPDHRHLLDVSTRELMCACRPCSLLFDRSAAGAGGRHYRLVPDRRLRIDDFAMDDVAWAELRLPVEMAFFFDSSEAGRVLAYYPGPMGATESLLGLEAWRGLTEANPVLDTLEPDVEALLVHRARGARHHLSCRSPTATSSPGSSARAGAGSPAGARCGRRSRASSTASTAVRGRPPATNERRPHGQGSREARRRRPSEGRPAGKLHGQLREDGRPLPGRAVERRAVDRHQPEGARADRPADAEPLTRVGVRRRPMGGDAAGSVPDLAFAVTGAGRLEHAAAPTVRFALRITSGGAAVRAIVLDVQVRIAATRRAYPRAADDRLFELFGARKDWGTTLRSLLWTRTTQSVPPFTGQTDVDLLVPCTYDLDVTATRYLDALPDGEVPLEFLFSGTVFYSADDGRLQTALLSWDLRPSTACPSRSGARRWTTTSPTAPGCASTARRTTGSSPTSRGARSRRGPP